MKIGVAAGERVEIENVTPQSEIGGLIASLREHLRMHHHGAQQHTLGSIENSPLGPQADLGLELPPQSPPDLHGIGAGDE